jgi:hypothetical protein
LARTYPAVVSSPPWRRRCSVRVVLPESGWEMSAREMRGGIEEEEEAGEEEEEEEEEERGDCEKSGEEDRGE